MNYLISDASSDAFVEQAMNADAVLDPNWPFNVPFTNQSAFQSAFTPAGFSFDAPFGHSLGQESSNHAESSQSVNGQAQSSSTVDRQYGNSAAGLDQPVDHLQGLIDKVPADSL